MNGVSEEVEVLLVALLVLAWIGAGLLAYGWSHAHYHRAFPNLPDDTRPLCALIALSGPVALVAWTFFSWAEGMRPWRYGWEW